MNPQQLRQYQDEARAAGIPEQFIQAQSQKLLQNAPVNEENVALQAASMQSKDKGFQATDLLPIAGGIIGGIGGSFIAPGAGTIVGGGAGSAAGEALRQYLTPEDDTDVGKVALEGGLGLAGGVAGKVIGKGASIVGKAITKGVPQRLMGSVFKEGIKGSKAAIAGGKTLGTEALERGQMGTTQKLFQTAETQIGNTENTLQEVLMTSNNKVPISQIRKTVQPLIDKYRQAGNLTDVKSIESRLAAIEAENGANIPAAAANQIKRSLYDEAQKSYGAQASEGMEGIKALARGIKESLESIPGVKQLNKDLSFYGRQRNSMLDKMTRDERNNILGLGNLGTLGMGALTGGAPGAVGLLAARNALGSTLGKTTIAQGLSKTGELAAKAPSIIGTGVSQTLGQGTSRLFPPFTPNSPGNKPSNNNGYYENPTPETNGGYDNSHINGTIPQNEQPVNTGQNPYPAENYAADVARDPKNRTTYKAMYDAYQEAYAGEKPEKKTQKQELFSTAAQGARHALALLEGGGVSVGPVSGRVESFKSGTVGTSQPQQDYMSTIALARSALLNAYLGGNIPPAEYSRISAGIPTETDPTPTAKQKLNTFIREIERFSNANVSGTQFTEEQIAEQAAGF